MIQKIYKATIMLGILLGLSVFLVAPAQAQTQGPVQGPPAPASSGTPPPDSGSIWGACDQNSANSAICAEREGAEATSVVKLLLNTAFYAIGVLSVIMIVFSGFKYINSRGDAEGVKSAKNTLLYAVIGLIVSMLAFVIVNYVISVFNGTKQDTNTSQTDN